MPERRGSRALAASAAALLAALLVAPAAWAQSDEVPPPPDGMAPGDGDGDGDGDDERWADSAFHAPFDADEPTLRHETVGVAGEFHYDKLGPADQIVQATVQVVDDPSDDFTPDDDCLLPPPAVVPGTGEETDDDPFTADLAFAVDLALPCNGRYLLQAEGRLNDPQRPPHTMERSFVLAALPAAVTEVEAEVDEASRTATVEFTPLAPDELDPDTTGYVVERAGPAGASGPGRYDDVATVGLDDDPSVVDDLGPAEAGQYSYRVRAVRDGADGSVRSSIIDTATATIDLEGPPTSTTSTTEQVDTRGGSVRSTGGRATLPRRRSTTSRQGPPTTLDTGFEETLDYGGRAGVDELAGDEPVAGQSIVRDEGESVDLAVPAAGALVLLGWAGHIVYLNRLAKQL